MSSTDHHLHRPVTVRVDAQNRVVLPKAVRDDAGVGPGQELVVFTDGPGRIVMTTRPAVVAELRAMYTTAPAEQDSITVIRRMREEEAAAEDERWERLRAAFRRDAPE